MREVTDGLIDNFGWNHIRADAPDRELLAAALERYMDYDTESRDPAVFDVYMKAVDDIARFEIAQLDDSLDRAGLLERLVVGQVVFGEILLILRRLAEEHHSHDRFVDDTRD